MANKQCIACGQSFKPRPQVPQQAYCSAPSCQRHRKRQWQRSKLLTDPDYQDNQNRAQQAWSKRNAGYWHKYRKSNPEYVERNRSLQRGRNAKGNACPVAKMDASIPVNPLPTGIYQLCLVTDDKIAKMDVWTVEITVHACESKPNIDIAKR